MLAATANFLAELLSIKREAFIELTTANCYRLFNRLKQSYEH
jgi:Tat protein secretion system quality control protein TatD with DNase activity